MQTLASNQIYLISGGTVDSNTSVSEDISKHALLGSAFGAGIGFFLGCISVLNGASPCGLNFPEIVLSIGGIGGVVGAGIGFANQAIPTQ